MCPSGYMNFDDHQFYWKTIMNAKSLARGRYLTTASLALLVLGLGALISFSEDAQASAPWHSLFRQKKCDTCGDGSYSPEMGGAWYWMRSPEQEKVVVASLYNRYCIRCHGVDGRGVWDMPGIPDFTNTRWQASRSDDQIVRIIIEGRGAVMPQFRGTITLEEACGMARYLRTFVPGAEVSRPDLISPAKTVSPKAELPNPKL
jgi:hypothetical protein